MARQGPLATQQQRQQRRRQRQQRPGRQHAWCGALVATALLTCGRWRSSRAGPGRLSALSFRSPGLAFLPPATNHGGVQSSRERGAVGRQVQAQAGTFEKLDSNYNPAWLEIQDNPSAELAWAHPQTAWAAAAAALCAFDIWRFLHLAPPTALEVLAAGLIYVGLYASRYQDVPKLEPHYRVSFYASCGWTLYAFASLVHAMSYGPQPVLPLGVAEAFHGGACTVYLGSCVYFYNYHWGRALRHLREGRLRAWFVLGLGSLTFVHGLTVGHIFKMLEDPGWFSTVAQIYPDQWQWIADTRLAELYMTAAALFLVILHLRGVLTGTKNALVVFLGTVIVPTAALMLETVGLRACAWQHYFMVGPKHF